LKCILNGVELGDAVGTTGEKKEEEAVVEWSKFRNAMR
jgi:hypothetical protein